MKLTLTLTMDNAAFFDDDRNESEPRRNAEVARILHTLAEKIETAWELEDGQRFALFDGNGNKVGQVNVSDDQPATPSPSSSKEVVP